MWPFHSQEKTYEQGVLDGEKKEAERARENLEKFRLAETEYYVGKPVIIVSNEWTNPVIGFGRRVDFITQARTPVLVVDDYLRGEEIMCQGALLSFSYQKFDAVMSLNPYDLCALLYNNMIEFNEFTKPKSGTRDSREVISDKLKSSGFFERLDHFLKTNDIENSTVVLDDQAVTKPHKKSKNF